MALTKDDLAKAIAESNGFPLNRSQELVETLLELIKTELTAGKDVLISSFGKFCVKEKGERRGRNPATGEDMMLEARRVVTFKCSGQLRKKINCCDPN
jgi:integration host factor subunit alpha